ncbi:MULTISPECIES: Zn-ribbon domain-containing OB-fold protein [unclassified Sphingobium]|uniref:Zn-ribbon domain-containing OB-fold protein n=1 Tax=unclassified Sphingobium TaxID=2611147 RepID=UPI00077033A1|nr:MULTISPECIES: OB-fold domain-containing protein [unclassified Sphingobium]AMK21502.1 hypothetical protein K426_02725 [Sphingobium sp. TKS]NML91869.1 hypothetical protein [Sphingobium sp. TB-6]
MTETVTPVRNRLNEAFWEGAERGQLVLPHCHDSGRAFWPPSPISPFTGGAVDWRQCDPAGRVESLIVYRRAFQQSFAHLIPYGIALVALDAGLRLMVHVENPDDAGAPCVGAAVTVGFRAILPDSMPLPVISNPI